MRRQKIRGKNKGKINGQKSEGREALSHFFNFLLAILRGLSYKYMKHKKKKNTKKNIPETGNPTKHLKARRRAPSQVFIKKKR